MKRVVAVLTGHILKDPAILQQIHQDASIAPDLANRPIRIPPDIAAVRDVLNSSAPPVTVAPPSLNPNSRTPLAASSR